MKTSPLFLVLVLLVGALLGAGALTLFSGVSAVSLAGRGTESGASGSAEPESAAIRASTDAARAPAPAPRVAQSGPGEPRSVPDRPVAESGSEAGSDALFSPALRAYASAELQRGWSELRQDPLPSTLHARLLADFEDHVLGMPSAWGRRAAAEANEREARASSLPSSDAIEWLGAVRPDDPELMALAQDPERLAPLFRPRSAGQAHDGPSLGEQDPLADGAVLSYPAGVFEVADLARGRDPFPADITLRGAGMNSTLLVMRGLSPRGALERLTLEDCTLFAENGIVDVRGGPSVLSLRRIRLVGFDCGAGGSYAMNLRACAISAVHCRFESGYGKSPHGLANLMPQTAPLVARFEDCVFERMSLAGADEASVSFARCWMNDMLEEPRPGPQYLDCRISLLAPAERHDEEVRRRDLEQLFPAWRERLR